jgi:hypothetical protein
MVGFELQYTFSGEQHGFIYAGFVPSNLLPFFCIKVPDPFIFVLSLVFTAVPKL